MKNVLILLFTLFTVATFSQETKRISVKGKIIVSSQDKEGVTVFNSSSNKGTITDENGNFEINVALNDVVEFGALQFKDFTVVISKEIIRTRQMTVILVEEINKLDEVVLLPFGLTGNLNADLENVRTFNADLDAIYFGLDNVTDFEFSADYKTKPENVAFKEYNPSMENMINVVNLAGFLLKQVADIDIKKKKSEKDRQINFTPFKQALDQYSINFIHSNFKIPLDEVDAFIDYVEKEGVDKELLKDDKEVLLLERINQLSKSYLKSRSDKD